MEKAGEAIKEAGEKLQEAENQKRRNDIRLRIAPTITEPAAPPLSSARLVPWVIKHRLQLGPGSSGHFCPCGAKFHCFFIG
jgi:hypothetical protein